MTRGKLSGWIVAAALLQGLAVAGPAKSEEAIAAPSAPQASAPWPSRVEAVYRVSFSGIDLGDFKFQSTVEGSSYSLSGNAELSHLFGLFNFSSILRSAGNVASETPRPLGYTFDFRTNGRGGSIRMNFADGAVAGLTTVPASPPTPAPSAPSRPRPIPAPSPDRSISCVAASVSTGHQSPRALT